MTPTEAAQVCRDVLQFAQLSKRPDQLFHSLDGVDDYAKFWTIMNRGVEVFRRRWEEVVAQGFMAGCQIESEILTSCTATDSAIDHYERVLRQVLELIEACNLAYAFQASTWLAKLDLPEGLNTLIQSERRFVLERDHRRLGGSSAQATAVAAVNNQIDVSLSPNFNVSVHNPDQQHRDGDGKAGHKPPKKAPKPTTTKSKLRKPSLADRSAFFAIRCLDVHIEKHYGNASRSDWPTTQAQKRDLLKQVIATWERAELNIHDDWEVPRTGKDLFQAARRFEQWIDAGNPDPFAD